MINKTLLEQIKEKSQNLEFKPIYREKLTFGEMSHAYPDEQKFFYYGNGQIMKGILINRCFIRQVKCNGFERLEKELFLLEDDQLIIFEKREIWTDERYGKTIIRKIDEEQSIEKFLAL